MKISLIAAKSENGVIGRGGKLPWHLPADLKRFKGLTTGHTVIMGRKTYESIGRPLPNRRSIIVTRNTDYRQEGVEVVNTFQEALTLANSEEEVYVIGGAEIFQLAVPRAEQIYLTLLHTVIDGDVFFPELDPKEWVLVKSERHEEDERNKWSYSFQRYERTREAC